MKHTALQEAFRRFALSAGVFLVCVAVAALSGGNQELIRLMRNIGALAGVAMALTWPAYNRARKADKENKA